MEDDTVSSFSQSLPLGDNQGNVPALMRHVAKTIETLGEVDILDIIMHSDIENSEDWPSFTVYYSKK